MAEHYTKNTVQASAYCRPCGKFTMHRVDGGRVSACLTCIANLEHAQAQPAAPEQAQMSMFGGSDVTND